MGCHSPHASELRTTHFKIQSQLSCEGFWLDSGTLFRAILMSVRMPRSVKIQTPSTPSQARRRRLVAAAPPTRPAGIPRTVVTSLFSVQAPSEPSPISPRRRKGIDNHKTQVCHMEATLPVATAESWPVLQH